jgi:hypothetical protein
MSCGYHSKTLGYVKLKFDYQTQNLLVHGDHPLYQGMLDQCWPDTDPTKWVLGQRWANIPHYLEKYNLHSSGHITHN